MTKQVALDVMFLGLQEPRDWEIEGRKGKTYRANIMTLDTLEPGTVKVSEELYLGLATGGVKIKDEIRLIFKSKFQLSVQNGRAVQELKFLPDNFQFLTEEAAD